MLVMLGTMEGTEVSASLGVRLGLILLQVLLLHSAAPTFATTPYSSNGPFRICCTSNLICYTWAVGGACHHSGSCRDGRSVSQLSADNICLTTIIAVLNVCM
jgi:hypothetical protein